jgi:DNA-binding MarR family transcriptional regulator
MSRGSGAGGANREAVERLLLDGLHSSTRALQVRIDLELRREGFTGPQFWTLHRILDQGPHTVGQLAEAMNVTPASASVSVDRLVGLGFVVRSREASDRRVQLIAITPKGHQAMHRVWVRVARMCTELLSDVPLRDIEVTSRVLQRLHAVRGEAVPGTEVSA